MPRTRFKLIFLAVVAIALGGCVQSRVTDIAKTVELSIGSSYRMRETSPLAVTLIESDQAHDRALLRVKNSVDGTTEDGWIQAGDYAKFSPLVGSHGIELKEVKATSVVVRFRGAGYDR
jgi:hypothetical protein